MLAERPLLNEARGRTVPASSAPMRAL